MSLYLLRSDTIDVEIGWHHDRLAYMCLVTQEDGEVVKQVETESAQSCIDEAQEFVERKIRSVWLYRLTNDQASPPRIPVTPALISSGLVEAPPSVARKKRAA